MFRVLIAAGVMLAPIPALAQDASGTPPQRIRNVLLKAGETCPKPANADEVVVCGRADDDQYRIPKRFRDEPSTSPANVAWGAKVDRVMDDAHRVLPDSCSPIGTAGQTGCALQANQQWAAERREARRTGN